MGAQLQEYMIDTGHCIGAAMAQQTDGAFYAAAPVANEAGWAIVYKDPHEEDIMQEDGSTKKVMINEGTQLKSLMDNLKAPPGGVWLGGKKFNMNRMADDEECGKAQTCKWAFGMSGKTGVHIVMTESQILAGFFDEEKKMGANCKKTTLEMAGYLIGEGY